MRGEEREPRDADRVGLEHHAAARTWLPNTAPQALGPLAGRPALFIRKKERAPRLNGGPARKDEYG